MIPYFYKIKHIPSGCYYVGSQYGKQSCPDNFFKTYFTSSKIIKTLIKNDGIESFIIEKILICNDARIYEKRYLKKSFNLLGKERFLQVFLNRNIAPGIINTPESLMKANSKEKRRKLSEAAIKRIQNKTHNFQLNNYKHSEEWHAKIQIRMRGAKNPSKDPELVKKRITDEYRTKQANGSRGNKNVRGKIWWNNGTTRKRSKETPGEEWVKGYRIIPVYEGVKVK